MKQFPWLDELAEVNESAWVYSTQETIKVENETPVLKTDFLSANEYIDIAKGWLGEL